MAGTDDCGADCGGACGVVCGPGCGVACCVVCGVGVVGLGWAWCCAARGDTRRTSANAKAVPLTGSSTGEWIVMHGLPVTASRYASPRAGIIVTSTLTDSTDERGGLLFAVI